jgi:plastocyanin
MFTGQSRRFRRPTSIVGAAALAAVFGGNAFAAERIVHVGQGGTKFVDAVSATKISTINAGDTITWVWEGDMNHSVTGGTCPDDGGGGGGGGYGYVTTEGSGSCTASQAWPSSGLHAPGFTLSRTFNDPGTFPYFCDAHGSSMTGKVVVQAGTGGGSACEPQPETLCLNNGRFQVKAEWEKPDGSSGHGTGVKLTGDSGYFWFFDPANIEAVAKVLNGCGLNNAYWVFAAGLTNVAVNMVVTDTQTGVVYTRNNSQGSAFPPVQDTGAFPSSCP